MASLSTLCSDPEGDTGASMMMNWYNHFTPPLTQDNYVWFNSGGPRLSGMPVPGGMACEIQPGAENRPGIKFANIHDAWKFYNTVTTVNTPGIAFEPGGTGWKTKVSPSVMNRSFNSSIWQKWYPDPNVGVSRPYPILTLDEIRDWPYLPPDRLGDIPMVQLETSSRYLVGGPWYLEKDTGAVYLNMYLSVGGSYQKQVGSYYQTFLVSSRLGNQEYVRGGDQPVLKRTLVWNTTVLGLPVEMNAQYWCWSPISQPVPVISNIENWYKGITFS